MNRLVGVLFVTAVWCTSVTAQQANKQSDAQLAPSVSVVKQGQEAPATPTFVFKPTFNWPLELPLSKTSTQQPQRLIVMPQSTFVFKDGALYIDVGNRVLLPAPGGGASGCFNWNLHERIERLRTVIETLPPRPPSTAPRK